MENLLVLSSAGVFFVNMNTKHNKHKHKAEIVLTKASRARFLVHFHQALYSISPLQPWLTLLNKNEIIAQSLIRRSKFKQHYVLGSINDVNLSKPSSLYNMCAGMLQGMKAKITFGFALISAR